MSNSIRIVSARILQVGASKTWAWRVARVLVAALFLACASRIKLAFWGTPVPFTLGPQAALLLAGVLGQNEGVAAVATWLMAGLLGGPVFASGLVGPQAFLGPSAGFMLGYLPGAWIVGRYGALPASGLKDASIAVLVWLFASVAIIACGALHLAWFFGPTVALRFGVAPFLFADGCKALLACAMCRGLFRPNR